MAPRGVSAGRVGWHLRRAGEGAHFVRYQPVASRFEEHDPGGKTEKTRHALLVGRASRGAIVLISSVPEVR